MPDISHQTIGDKDLLGELVRYTDSVGIEQIGRLVGIVTEPSYIIARSHADSDLVIAQSKVRNLRPAL